MKKRGFIIACLLIIAIVVVSVSSSSEVNTVGDPHFTEEGYLVADTEYVGAFKLEHPSKIKYYIEVSGSMNGFFRANQPTSFKKDVWEIMSYFSALPSEVTVLTNKGDMGARMSIDAFRQQMNTGSFISSASTQVPIMLSSIVNDIKPEEGEVAILISDMKYSPVGAAAPKVLMEQYSSDISRTLGTFHKPICLVGAVSNYLEKNAVVDESPYYFFIIGNEGAVAYLRNSISTLLDNNGHFIDNIESGFDYGAPSYSFGIPEFCYQLDDQPTFVDYDESASDTCIVNLKVDLSKYRWIMADTTYFKNAFKCEALYGSNVEVGNIKIEVQNITKKKLERTAIANVQLKVYDFALESEVIKWTLELPDMDCQKFGRFMGAISEADNTKTFSLEGFIGGIFYGGITSKSLKDNYILISKNS